MKSVEELEFHEYDTNMDGTVSAEEYKEGFEMMMVGEILRILFVTVQASLGIFMSYKGYKLYKIL